MTTRRTGGRTRGSGASAGLLRRARAWARERRDAFRASNQVTTDELPEDGDQHAQPASPGQREATGTDGSDGRDGPDHDAYGPAGRPLNRQSPFYMGFVGAIGVLVAYALLTTLSRLTTTLTLLLVSIFLALALNPIVDWITARGVRRWASVALVFVGLLVVFAAIGMLVVPPVVQQGTELAKNAPDYVEQLLNSNWVQQLDHDYNITDKIQEEFQKRITSGDTVGQVFGGVLGAGKAVVSGVFQTFTVFILTLYFLASLPRVKQAAYRMVPASRRERVSSLSEEILRRVGSYAIGQVAVAAINAICSWIMMTIIGVPYAAVLAVVVGFLGIIPMVGATLGAVLVVIVAFFTEPRLAIIAGVYYIVYQQVENYLIAPKVMQRTVSVPGAVTVVAALAGGTLLGVLGALIAIPVAAGLLLLYEQVLVPRQSHA